MDVTAKCIFIECKCVLFCMTCVEEVTVDLWGGPFGPPRATTTSPVLLWLGPDNCGNKMGKLKCLLWRRPLGNRYGMGNQGVNYRTEPWPTGGYPAVSDICLRHVSWCSSVPAPLDEPDPEVILVDDPYPGAFLVQPHLTYQWGSSGPAALLMEWGLTCSSVTVVLRTRWCLWNYGTSLEG